MAGRHAAGGASIAGQADGAVGAHTEAIATDPSNSAAFVARGRLCLPAGDREKAFTAYGRGPGRAR